MINHSINEFVTMNHKGRIDYHSKVILKVSDILYTKIDIERRKTKKNQMFLSDYT